MNKNDILIYCILLLFICSGFKLQPDSAVIVDSSFTFEEAIEGKDIPESIQNNLALVPVEYYSFDEKLHKGQLIIHKNLVKDITEIFQVIKDKKFPVNKVIPVVYYNWDDKLSMQNNNTSAFNYRTVKGSKKLSYHSFGKAVDINPWLNPMVRYGKSSPEGSMYKPGEPGTIVKDSFLVKEFTKRGWKWGGSWRSVKDYQHFEKL